MATLSSWLHHRIFDSCKVTAEGLALYRIATASFVLLFGGPGFNPYFAFAPFATLPDAMYLPPPGVMQLIPGFPSEVFFQTLQVMIVLAWVAILFGYQTRIASPLATVLMLVGFGYTYSVGKINHNILFVLLPFVMGLSNWGAAFSIDAKRGRVSPDTASWPIPLMMLLTGFAMFTAGFPKILGGWLDPVTQAARSRFVKGFFVNDRTDLLAEAALTVQSDVLWELLDIATVAFEIGFLFALVSPWSTRLFAAGAVFFHTGVMLIMNIAFPTNFIVYAAVLPWSRMAEPVHTWVSRLRPFSTARYVSAAGIVAIFFTIVGSPLLWLDFGLASDLQPVDILVVVLGLLTVLALVILKMWNRSVRLGHELYRPLKPNVESSSQQ
ncbi:hypothetical protein CRI94_14950 [Longibacter salinarum]|uniref:HTTM domain-containing protein n=1 Tax=Longibacter salinarum TaxID=1850348 RepID=A0A2A8CV26_9BACT|nr:HTTM domain-containing protein [Longibacter salinarum]PEN12317.1 hypothetical protein CRI94_14950 [Longibacter salinarum]